MAENQIWRTFSFVLVMAFSLLGGCSTDKQNFANSESGSESVAEDLSDSALIPIYPFMNIGAALELLGPEDEKYPFDVYGGIHYQWSKDKYQILILTTKNGEIEVVTYFYTGTEIPLPYNIVLGKDDAAKVEIKLSDHLKAGTRSMLQGEGRWAYSFAAISHRGKTWAYSYTFFLEESDPEDWELLRQPYPPTPDTFAPVVLAKFSLVSPDYIPSPRRYQVTIEEDR